MKHLFKNKKLRNIIIVILATAVSLWGYQEFVRYSIKKQIYELTHIEGQTVADYKLIILVGEKCISTNGSDPELYQAKPQNIPVLNLMLSALKAQGCTFFGRGRYKAPHMEIKIYQNRRKEAYQTSSGEIIRYEFYYWSFKENKFVNFSYFIGGVGGENSLFYSERNRGAK